MAEYLLKSLDSYKANMFNLSTLVIFLISALNYAYNMFGIIQSGVIAIT